MHFPQDTWLTRASRQLARVEQLLCNVLMVAFSVLLIANVFARYNSTARSFLPMS